MKYEISCLSDLINNVTDITDKIYKELDKMIEEKEIDFDKLEELKDDLCDIDNLLDM